MSYLMGRGLGADAEVDATNPETAKLQENLALLARTASNVGVGLAAQTAQSFASGKYQVRYDPKSGLPIDPGTGAIMDPRTNWPATPQVIEEAIRERALQNNAIFGVIAVLGVAAVAIAVNRQNKEKQKSARSNPGTLRLRPGTGRRAQPHKRSRGIATPRFAKSADAVEALAQALVRAVSDLSKGEKQAAMEHALRLAGAMSRAQVSSAKTRAERILAALR